MATLQPPSVMDHYQVLGVRDQATAIEIKKAFQQLALKYHPDKASDEAKAEGVQDPAKNMSAINDAYECLKDQTLRRTYDMGLTTLRRKWSTYHQAARQREAAAKAEEKRQRHEVEARRAQARAAQLASDAAKKKAFMDKVRERAARQQTTEGLSAARLSDQPTTPTLKPFVPPLGWEKETAAWEASHTKSPKKANPELRKRKNSDSSAKSASKKVKTSKGTKPTPGAQKTNSEKFNNYREKRSVDFQNIKEKATATESELEEKNRQLDEARHAEIKALEAFRLAEKKTKGAREAARRAEAEATTAKKEMRQATGWKIVLSPDGNGVLSYSWVNLSVGDRKAQYTCKFCGKNATKRAPHVGIGACNVCYNGVCVYCCELLSQHEAGCVHTADPVAYPQPSGRFVPTTMTEEEYQEALRTVGKAGGTRAARAEREKV